MDAKKLLDQAVAAERAGRNADAARTLEKILRYQPGHSMAARMLANVHLRSGRISDAEGALRAAYEATTKSPAVSIVESEALAEAFVGLLARTNPAEAEARAGVEISRRPGAIKFILLLGDARLAQRKFDGAIEAFRAAVTASPARAFPRVRLGQALRIAGRTEEAIDATRDAVNADPQAPEPHHALGLLLQETGQFDLAEAAFRKAIELRRDYVAGLGSLAALLQRVGRYEESLAAHENAVRAHPKNATLRLSFGHLHNSMGKPDDAERSYREAIELDPRLAAAWTSLSTLMSTRNKPFAAIQSGRNAVDAGPNFGPSFSSLGMALHNIGEAAEAAKYFARGYELSRDPAIGSNLLHCLNYVPTFSRKDVFETHREWARHHADNVRSPFDHTNHKFDSSRRIRVGYFSPDFRAHAVSHFVEPLIAGHDRQKFEVFCYASVFSPDATTQRLKSQADQWRDVARIGDQEAAKLMNEDGIDILVDLAGHTSGHRLSIFALWPAPIQVSYQGYPNTTGLKQIDYRLTDALADPPDADEFHSEKLHRLPKSAWCYRPTADAPDVSELPAASGAPFTFGSFNRLSKVPSDTARMWSRAVLAVPNARLMFKTFGLDEPETEKYVRELFGGFGLSGDRLVLIGADKTPLDHLRRYGKIDLALDAFPYHGTTTSCEAMWMGVPSVTRVGDRHVSRVGLSLLSNIGLLEFAVDSEDAFVAKAAEMAGNISKLSEIRRSMRDRMKASPLMREKEFYADVEAAYEQMVVAYHPAHG